MKLIDTSESTQPFRDLVEEALLPVEFHCCGKFLSEIQPNGLDRKIAGIALKRGYKSALRTVE